MTGLPIKERAFVQGLVVQGGLLGTSVIPRLTTVSTGLRDTALTGELTDRAGSLSS